MTLKDRIKELCKKNGISMNQLEEELGFGSGYISKLGKSTPNSKYIQKIADYFGVSVDYLMTGEESQFTVETADSLTGFLSLDKKVRDYCFKFAELSDSDKEFVMQMIDKLSVGNK